MHAGSSFAMSDRAETNPYVGPRPFEAADRDRFFGRDREIRQLASLIVAKRVVVLYARSGAGKTSLLRAGLIPFLEERKRLEVLPIVRIGGELTEPTLAEGLERHLASLPEGRASTPRLLIADQFEELFRAPALFQQQEDFFAQLERCLELYPRLGLLLSLREDAVAELDPYAGRFPDRLRVRFRLELLGVSAAQEALQKPAHRAGFDLADVEAKRWVDELRAVRIQRPDGSSEEVLGPHVEPVHLQLLGHRLWIHRAGRLSGGESAVDEARVVGSVDEALTSYYEEQLSRVADATGSPERPIRDWFDDHLITEHELRGQVLQGVGESEGLANEVIAALVDTRLVRSEKRRGATWYELSHDRLLAPIRASNAAWRREHLSPLQRRADLWVREGRPRSMLLNAAELRKAQDWAETHDDPLTAPEEDLLAVSRRRRRTRRLSTLVLAASLLLAGSLWLLWQEQVYGERELARGLAAQTRSRLDEQLDLALLLSLEANRIDGSSVEARGSLLAALQYQPRLLSSLHGHEATVWSTAFSPAGDDTGGARLASGDLDGRILLWDVDRRQRAEEPLLGHSEVVLGLAFSPGGSYLISTGRDGKVLRWDLSRKPARPEAMRHDLMVTSAAFDPRDDRRLITGDTGGEVSIWDLAEEPPLRWPIGRHEGWVTSVAVDPSGSGRVASGGVDRRVRIWAPGRTRGKAPGTRARGPWSLDLGPGVGTRRKDAGVGVARRLGAALGRPGPEGFSVATQRSVWPPFGRRLPSGRRGARRVDRRG